MALSIVSESPAESNAPLSIINEEPVGPSRLQRAAEKFSENYPVEPAADIFPAVEPALNLGTALTLGFPAYVGGGLGTLAARGLGLTDEDPQAVGERFARAVTYQPQTEEGKALTGAATYPLSWLQEASVAGGQHVADIAREAGLPDWAAAGAGAFTEAGAQMAPAIAGVFTPRGAAAVRPAAAARPPVEELKEVEPGVYARPAEKPAEAAAEPLRVVNEEPAPKAGAEPLTVAKEEPAPIAPEDRATLVSQRGNAASFAQEAEKAAEQHAETNPELAMRWKQSAETAHADVAEMDAKLGAGASISIVKEEAALPSVESKFADFLGKAFKKDVMEGRGQEILDDMEAANVSPNEVAKTFWSDTYFKLPAPVQARFNKMMAIHTGGLEPIVQNLDLPNDVAGLEGTERGFVALMREGNNRVAESPLTRLGNPDVRSELEAMGRETGWAEVGGKIIRERGLEGEVVGRTKWIPNADWWPDRPKGLKESQVQDAVSNALNGEDLSVPEGRIVNYMLDVANERVQSKPYAPTNTELATESLKTSDTFDGAMIARASEANPDAVERLAITHENDDVAFMRGIKELLNEKDEGQKVGIVGQADIGAQAKGEAAGAVAAPIWYHGTKNRFDQFQPIAGGAARQSFGDAYFFSNRSDLTAADMAGKTGHVMPAELTMKNPMKIEGSMWGDPRAEAKLIKQAKADGYDSIMGTTASGEEKFAVVFNANQISRSMRPELTYMHAGINPLEAVKAYRESYTPFIGVEAAKPIGKSFGASLRKIFAPASLSLEAQKTANIVRANLGRQAMEKEQAVAQMRDAAAMFDKMPVADNYKFIAAMEGGAKISDPKLADAASQIRNLLDTKRGEVQALGNGQLENFIENYFPHIWADESKAQLLLGRRPLEGSKAFLKPRTYDTFSEGIDAGLKPITNNPVELALLKAQEMDRYIYGQKIFQEMKDAKLAKFVKFGKTVPDGYAKINDKIARVTSYSKEAGGQVIRGEYYAPGGAALIINNHLSPGLRGNGAFDMWRQSGNMMNAAQLGMSAFHLGFTTLDAMVSKNTLGVQQLSRGDIGKGIANIALSFSPAQPILNLIKGDRLLRAYLGELKDPSLAPIVDALVEAGGRIKMDDFYRNTTVNAFKNALRAQRYGAAVKQLLPTLVDRINAPIFQYLVPRQKLGVFFDMAKDALEENPDMDLATKRQLMGKLWDNVDDRMGQMTYDNLFWNRTLKDSLMASVRSVGWNMGDFRAAGGGITDLKDVLKNRELTNRSAYLISLPFMIGVIGSAINYLYTGEGPQDMKDMFFPRTGKTRPDGTEDRISLPSYMKDVYEYGHDISGFIKYGADPTKTLQNKAHPLVSTVAQMISNQDFFGATIRNASSPLVEQIGDEAEYLLKQVMPFSLRNYLQQQKLKKEPATLSGYITSPSMFGVIPSPGYITKTPAMEESAAITANLNPMERKFRQEIKDGADRGVVIQKMQRAGFMPRDIIYVLRSSQENRPLPRLRAYGESPEDQARAQQLHDLGIQAQIKILREERQGAVP